MLERVQKIINKNQDFFKVKENPNIQTLCELDPTPNKKYLNWILNQFKVHKIKEEDHYKFNELLTKFHSGKHKLSIEERNINRVGSINDLFDLVNQIPTSKNEENKLDKEKAYKESIIHYNQDGFKVIEPLTEFASCFWGKRTNWCTASTSSKNYFSDYTQGDEYLLIIITPEGKKYQISSCGDFCDSSDNLIQDDPIKLFKYIPLDIICAVSRLFSAFLEWNHTLLSYVKKPTKELISLAIKFDHRNLGYVSGEDQTEEICIAAVQINGSSLKYVEIQTPHICMEAVKQTGWALKYVEVQTPEICLLAVQNTGGAIHYVKKQTKKLCLVAVRKDGYCLKYVIDQTPHICMEAVKQNGLSLRYVKNQTEKLCLAAVKQNGSALAFVEDQNDELCLIAVKQIGSALRYVKNQTLKICNAAVKQDIKALRYVDKKFRKHFRKNGKL